MLKLFVRMTIQVNFLMACLSMYASKSSERLRFPKINQKQQDKKELSEPLKTNAQFVLPKEREYLKSVKMCPTDGCDLKNASTADTRALTYKALEAIGLQHPELVFVFNNKNDDYASVGVRLIRGKNGIAVHYNEQMFRNQPFGVRYLALLHEAFHLKEKHYEITQDEFYLISQWNENQCDKAAAYASGCKKCIEEFANFFLIDPTYLVRKNYSSRVCTTINDFKFFSPTTFERLLGQLSRDSQSSKDEHPLGFERAMRIYTYSLRVSTVCKRHNCTR